MAYQQLHVQYTPSATTANLQTFMETQMVQLGWTIHDQYTDTDPYTVFSSDGEAGDRPTGYIQMHFKYSYLFFYYVWEYWDSGTHTGLFKALSTDSQGKADCAITQDAYIDFFGDKDLVYIDCHWSTRQYGQALFGHIVPLNDQKTQLTSDASAGIPKQIEVGSTAGFQYGDVLWFHSDVGARRDWGSVITSIDSSTTMTVDTLPADYYIDDWVGIWPFLFGGATSVTGASLVLDLTADRNHYGTTAAAAGCGVTAGVTQYEYFNPAGSMGKYILQPVVWGEYQAPSNPGAIGVGSDHYLKPPLSGTGTDYYYIVGVLDNGTATAGGSSTLTDSGKSWSTDVHQDKFIFIDDGTGAPCARKIASNTSDTITTVEAFDTTPDTDSEYFIVDEVWYTGYSGFAWEWLR